MSETPGAHPEMDAFMAQSIPLLGQIGLRMVEAEPGRVSARVPLEGNSNHLGTMYAGVLFTVAEVLGGAIASTSFPPGRYYPLVKDVRIAFRRPATTPVVATATLGAEEIARIEGDAKANGKGEYLLEAELTDSDGTVVATTAGTYQIRPMPT